MNRRRFRPNNRQSKPIAPTDDAENLVSPSQEIFDECEKLKQKILSTPNGKIELWTHRQKLLDQYERLILCDLDYAIEKKIEHDLWTIIFKNEISYKQEQLKENSQNQAKRAEIQMNLQNFYEYARGYYMKLLQDVVHSYNFENSICKLTFPFLQKRIHHSNQTRSSKEASMLYFIQHILVHVGDLNRYSNHIDLAKTFYQYAIHTIPCLGQPYNQIAILHEMKNPWSLLTPGQNQLITTFYYIRSIAIKVTFPLAISNLEKLFQRLKDIPLTRYQEQQNDFLTLFLQIIAMINLEINLNDISSFMNLFRTMIVKNFNQLNFIQMITIIMFTLHRTLDLLPRSSSSKNTDLQYDIILQLFIIIIEQCLEAIQVPLSMMMIDEQYILPLLYLSFAYLSNMQKYKIELFEHNVFKQKPTMWNSLAKLLRSFGVYASSLDVSKDKNDSCGSLFFKYSDYPLSEERMLECFTPLNDILKPYNFKKYAYDDDDETANEHLIEKDIRQLRKLRLVSILRNLCQKSNEKTKKKIFDHLITYAKDEIVCFESSTPVIQQIPSSNFGVPGDRRTTQKPITDESKSYNPNGSNTKPPRGARNVALRQFLEPAIAACESATNNRSLNQRSTINDNTITFPPPPPPPPLPPNQSLIGDSDAWPRLPSSCDSKDLFQSQSFDYELRPDSVWSNNEESKDQFPFQSVPNHQILSPDLMFPHSVSKHNPKQQPN